MGARRGHVDPRIKAIARRRIDILFALALKAAECGLYHWSQRYIKLAKRVGMKATVPIPKKWRPYYCRRCCMPLVGGKTARVRIRNGKAVATCLTCGNVRRVPLHTKT